MDDMYEQEQKILDDSLEHLKAVRSGTPVCADLFERLVKEFKLLLKHQRKLIRISDRASTNMITGQKEQISELTSVVHYDGLTGIYNRRYMEENLISIIKLMSRSGGKLSVLMMDIDFFKKYNDTYGHSQGDDCLKDVAVAIAGAISRSEDFVARYGGEEFAVILPNTDAKGAQDIAAKINSTVQALNILHEKNEAAGCVTVSIGVTTGDVEPGQKGEDYIKRADEALYMSKNNGRNQYTYLDFKA